MKAIITTSILLSTIALIGCNPNAVLETRKAAAPQQESEAGFIVKADSEQQITDLLNENPTAQYRLINKTHQIYEVFNLATTQLEESSINVMAKNKIIKLNSQKFEPYVTAQTENENQPNCASQSRQGDIKIKDEDKYNLKSIPQESPITFEPTEINHANKYYWMVGAPKGSKYHSENPKEPFSQKTTKFNFAPDSLGGHVVLMVVETPTGHCEVQSIKLVITKNTPYKKLNTNNTGENAGEIDYHHLDMIGAYEAQQFTKGEGVLVAVIDTGVNYLHEDLNAQIYVNTKEIPNNGIDDDNNGLIDDYAGYDFQNNDAHPYDDAGHGSHVSGLIAGKHHGVAPKATILPLKALGDFGGDLGSIYSALLYAIEQGADVVNMSLGHAGAADPFETFVMSKAEEAGVLVVTAAGNGNAFGVGINTDRSGVYPANLPHKNILNIASMSLDKDITRYSNYGKTTVDISAPGGSPKHPIESLSHENPKGIAYAKMMGTSMAAPVSTGAVALALSVYPDLTPEQTIQLILETGDDVPSLKNKTLSGKKINAKNLVYQNKINQMLTAN